MAPSNFTPNERLVRKRLAARLRQRRCRERKRELAMTGVVPAVGSSKESSSDNKSVEASGDNSTVYSSNKSTPTSSPTKVTPVYVDIQNVRPPNQGYGWHYPSMPPGHSRGPSFHYHHHPPHANGYYGGSSHHHHHHQPPMIPVMYPPHHHQYVSHPPALSYAQQPRHMSHGPHYPVPFHGPLSHGLPPPHHPLKQANPNHRPTTAAEPGDVSRTVSRSPSDASLNSGKRTVATAHIKKETEDVVSVEMQNEATSSSILEPISGSADNHSSSQALSHKKEKRMESKNPNSLMSTEKAAVAAMLSMKSSSDESDGDSTSTSTLKSLPLVPGNSGAQQKRQRTALPLLAAV